jgi:hypothetical protein
MLLVVKDARVNLSVKVLGVIENSLLLVQVQGMCFSLSRSPGRTTRRLKSHQTLLFGGKVPTKHLLAIFKIMTATPIDPSTRLLPSSPCAQLDQRDRSSLVHSQTDSDDEIRHGKMTWAIRVSPYDTVGSPCRRDLTFRGHQKLERFSVAATKIMEGHELMKTATTTKESTYKRMRWIMSKAEAVCRCILMVIMHQ